MSVVGSAEELLKSLGITEPEEIDIEAIAYHVGASVKYRQLQGCEARIIGHANKAIITVNSLSSPPRRRFSIAHELGHWRYHRGQHLACKAEDIVRPISGANSPEKVADRYAAELLMPGYLLRPFARSFQKLTFRVVAEIAEKFQTSVVATAIRLVEKDYFPTVLVCHARSGRRWFTRAPGVPQRWFPQDTLDADSFAFGVLFGSKPDDLHPRKMGADAWFDRREATAYELHEQTIRFGSETLTLLTLPDRMMREDYS